MPGRLTAVEPIAITRSHGAYVELKRRILRLEMPPGSYFTEGELVVDLGIGKTPVREALTRLRQEGFVLATARSGYQIAPVTIKEARDLLATRTLLEGTAAKQAADGNRDPDRLHELESLCVTSYVPQDPNSVARFLEANTAFHAGVAELSGNSVLADLLRLVLERLERLFHLGLALASQPEEVVHAHTDLVAAILHGDGDEAQRLAIEQGQMTQVMVLNALLASSEVQSAPLDGALR